MRSSSACIRAIWSWCFLGKAAFLGASVCLRPENMSCFFTICKGSLYRRSRSVNDDLLTPRQESSFQYYYDRVEISLPVPVPAYFEEWLEHGKSIFETLTGARASSLGDQSVYVPSGSVIQIKRIVLLICIHIFAKFVHDIA